MTRKPYRIQIPNANADTIRRMDALSRTLTAETYGAKALAEVHQEYIRKRDAIRNGREYSELNAEDRDRLERLRQEHLPDLIAFAKALRDKEAEEERTSGGSFGWYFLAYEIIREAERRVERSHVAGRLMAVSGRMDAVEKAHGLKHGECWPLGEGPKEYRALVAEYDRESDMIFTAIMREYGETEMADLFELDRPAFDAKFEVGRKIIFGDPPRVSVK